MNSFAQNQNTTLNLSSLVANNLPLSSGGLTQPLNSNPHEFTETDPFQNHLDQQLTLLEGNKEERHKLQELPKAEIFAEPNQKTDLQNEGRYIGKERIQFEKTFEDKQKEKTFGERIELHSEEYKEYLEQLFTNNAADASKRAHICITCWQYQGIGQKYSHARLGHMTMFCYELKSEEQFLEYAKEQEKIITEADGKQFIEPIKAYQRKTPNMISDSFQTLSNHSTGHIPLMASNTVYLDELRKLMAERFALDQDTLIREQALRNKEEFLLKKKQTNVVDEVMLGIIRAEKCMNAIKLRVKDYFGRVIAEKEQECNYYQANPKLVQQMQNQ